MKDQLSLLEQLAREPAYTGHILVRTDDGLLPMDICNGHPRINCSLLIEPWHLFSQVAEALFECDRSESIRLIDLHSFCAFVKEQDKGIGLATLVLEGVDDFHHRDGILWPIINFALIVPHSSLKIKLILATRHGIEDYQWMFQGGRPFFIDIQSQSNFLNDEELVGTKKQPKIWLDYDVILLLETYLQSFEGELSRQYQISLKNLKPIIQQAHQLFRHHIGSLVDLHSHVHLLLSLYNNHLSSANSTLNLAAMYQGCRETITSYLRGDHLQQIHRAMIRNLPKVEQYVLIAAYLASHNLAKHDLRIFGNSHSARRSRSHSVTSDRVGRRKRSTGKGEDDAKTNSNSTSITSVTTYTDRLPPRLFPLDRLLAIFYFIYQGSAHAPPLVRATRAIEELVMRGWLQRVTIYSKLEMPRYRCLLSQDVILILSHSLRFALNNYLYRNVT